MPLDLAQLEARLWDAADELRANSGLKASEYGTPVLGLIFLRFADAKFNAASAGIEAKASARRTIGPSDYHAQRVLYLTETARFDHLLALPEGADLGKAINDAMRAIEEHNPELAGVLPKTYTSIENTTIASLLRHINSYTKGLEGDAFGHPSARSATPTTTRWPRASSTASKPSSSATASGAPDRSSSSPSSSTSAGSTTTASTRASVTFHLDTGPPIHG